MRSVSLFSGIGAASLAVEAHFGAETVAFVEQDKHAQAVLRRHNPGVLIFDDVRTVGAHNLPSFDCLEAGTPCQGFSAAGAGKGFDDDRSGLWREMIRIADECKPRLVFIENVPALLSKHRGRVESDFAGIGYGVTWAKVAAQHVEGCPHRRMRVFILARLGGRRRGVCDAGPLPPLQAWPTPRATDDKDGRGKRSNRTPEAIAKAGATLPESVQPQHWPTPAAQEPGIDPVRLVDKHGNPPDSPMQRCYDRETGRLAQTGLTQAVRWSTPCADDDRDRGDVMSTPAVQRRVGKKQLNLSMQAGGRLSPLWVEALMGLPVGYTSADGPPMREQALALMRSPQWPAPMVKGLWGDSPQHGREPPRTVPKGWGAKGERAARLKALGNCNPPAHYLLALQLLQEGPRQASIFGLLDGPAVDLPW